MNDRLAKLEELKRLKRENALYFYKPYPKQLEFHEAGKAWRERMFMAGNQLGKTLSAGAEAAMHLTGIYPEWWTGRRFQRPVRAWAAGVTSESTRDTCQRMLLGQTGDFGTGMVPKANILKTSAARGTADAVETLLVRHPLGQSQLTFKSYSDGREKWQGETLDFVWFDEEPPQEIYTEGLTRTNATGGMVMITETPLLGMSEVVRSYLGTNGVSRKVVTMTIDDVEHYTEAQKAQIIEAYPEHEREARAKGIPFLGSGRVFPVEESLIVCEPVPIPKHWYQLQGMDFGWDHPAAITWLAIDRDADCIYVVDEFRRSKATIGEVASAAKKRGPLPVAWPHDGLMYDKQSGIQVAQLFRKEGLNMISEHAQFPDDRKMGVEAGVLEMLSRMTTGRWKVFSTCQNWLEEFRLYHRKDGKIVKEHDDLLCSSRYAMMMQRYGLQVEALPKKPERYRKKVKHTSWMAA